MRNSYDDIKTFNSNDEDFGLKPLDTPLTEEEKKLAALGMAFNAAVIQFVLEGIIPFEEQAHFMLHAGDFAERLYRGEKIKLPNMKQTLVVDSVAGRLYANAAIDELEHGHKNMEKARAMSKALGFGQEEQTNKVEDGEKKPTFH